MKKNHTSAALCLGFLTVTTSELRNQVEFAALVAFTLGRREDLYQHRFAVSEASFVDGTPSEAFRARVRIRHRAEPVPGLVRPYGPDWRVELDQPAWAPAAGQAAVFYDDGDAVIGGGRIITPTVPAI